MDATPLELENPKPTRYRPATDRRLRAWQSVWKWRSERRKLTVDRKRALTVRMMRAARDNGRLKPHQGAGAGLSWRSSAAEHLAGWLALTALWGRPGVIGRLEDWAELLGVSSRTVRRAAAELAAAGWLEVVHRYVQIGRRAHRQRASMFVAGPALLSLLRMSCPPSRKLRPESDISHRRSFLSTSPKGGHAAAGTGNLEGASSPAPAARSRDRGGALVAPGQMALEGLTDARKAPAADAVAVRQLLAWTERAKRGDFTPLAGEPGQAPSSPATAATRGGVA